MYGFASMVSDKDEIFDIGGTVLAEQLRISYARLFRTKAWQAVGRQFGLTPRELQVAVLLCRGYSQQKMAAELSITQGTVKNHRKAINRKLRCSNSRRTMLKLILATGLLTQDL